MASKRKNASPELHAHRAILKDMRKLFGGAVIHHSPNEFGANGKEIARQIAKHKSMGMVVGFSDLIMLWQGKVFCFEVKAGSNPQSPAQECFEADVKRNGGFYAVVKSIDDVISAMASWGYSPIREVTA